MRFYFEGAFWKGYQDKLAKIAIEPDTKSRACREIYVIISDQFIEEPKSGDEVSFALVGERKTPMIFPNKSEKPDNRILLMGNIPQPSHRNDGRMDVEKTTAQILDVSNGGGAWGSGSSFLAILEEGERVVSNKFTVWSNVKGELVKEQMTGNEYEMKYESPKIDFM